MRFIIVVTLAAACGGGGASSSSCEAVRACCDALPSAQAMSCDAQLDQVEARGVDESACQQFLSQLRASGGCQGMSAAPSDLGTPAGQQPAVCMRYVSCSTLVQPASAAALLQAYGPDGTCWSSTAEVAQTCVAACQSGLQQLHPSRPNDPACALCGSDAECGGATPACGPNGTCVECTSDADCGGATPACDVATHTCVGCVDDAACGGRGCDLATHTCHQCGSDGDCSGNTPACVNHVCMQCASDAQCESGRCENDHSCCVPKATCSLFGVISYDCGSDDDGCGHTVDCGSCSVGTCQNHFCSNLGVSCTIGDSTCVTQNGERCMYDFSRKVYVCGSSTGEGGMCGMTATDCSGDFISCDYNRTPEVCRQLCASSAECDASKSCQSQNGNAVSTSNPGYCM